MLRTMNVLGGRNLENVLRAAQLLDDCPITVSRAHHDGLSGRAVHRDAKCSVECVCAAREQQFFTGTQRIDGRSQVAAGAISAAEESAGSAIHNNASAAAGAARP